MQKRHNNTSNTTASTQPVKIKPPKVRPHKTTKVQVRQLTEVTEASLDDFDVSTSGDANGIYITILYNSRPIYKFMLSNGNYDNWRYRMDDNQKLQYVTMRVNANASVFGNQQITQTVIMAIYTILNNIFAEAERIKAQQAQKRMI